MAQSYLCNTIGALLPGEADMPIDLHLMAFKHVLVYRDLDETANTEMSV